MTDSGPQTVKGKIEKGFRQQQPNNVWHFQIPPDDFQVAIIKQKIRDT